MPGIPLLVLLAALAPGGTAHAGVAWKALAPGLELATLVVSPPAPVGDSRITVVRADPGLWSLAVVGQTFTGDEQGKTAREFAATHDLVLAINAGMFASDYRTHVGYLASDGHVNCGKANDYQSVAAFDPVAPAGGRPPFRIFDLDDPGVTLDGIRRDYGSVVQNLRLIRRPGSNRWSAQEKKWSEAALGEDREGRILFIYARSPFSMHDLNRELLAAGIGVVAAQHLEGGPEAQLYLHLGDVELEMFGSYETGFMENDGNGQAWPVPLVLGLRPKPAAP